MNTPAHEDILGPLRVARDRLSAQYFLAALVKCGLAAGASLLILAAVNCWALGRIPWQNFYALWAVSGVFVAALAGTLLRRRGLRETAVLLDRLGGTHDRFLTALSFANAPASEPMRALAVAECRRFVRAGSFRHLLPVRMPGETLWLLVPAVAIALLQWQARHTFEARDAAHAAARASVEDTARHLEQLARETARAAEQNHAEELQRLAEQLRRGAEQLRAEATNPEDAGKSALRELSALEQMVQDLQKTPSAPTPEEMQALAKALAQHDVTKEAAAALAAGDPAGAAKALEEEMQKLDGPKEEAASEEMRQALEKAIQQLAQEKQLSEALQKLAQEMKQSAAAQTPGGKSSEAARQLAQMLRQMAQGKSGQAAGGKPGAQSLESLLAALQNMKAGDGQSSPGSSPPPGPAPGGVKMDSFSRGDPGASPLPGDPTLPSGRPGGEHDAGTTDSALGQTVNPPGQDGQRQQLAGREGEGESLQQSLQSAGDHSKAHRGYKNLYEAMAPAAQDAVLQENIPLGSRFLIKRYFESIRPSE